LLSGHSGPLIVTSASPKTSWSDDKIFIATPAQGGPQDLFESGAPKGDDLENFVLQRFLVAACHHMEMIVESSCNIHLPNA